MRLCSCLLIGLCLMGCAKSSLGRGLNIGVGVSATADYVTTRIAIQQGHVEGNPVMGQDAWRQALLKIGGVGAVIGLAHLLENKGSPVLAHVLRVAVISLNSYLALHNYGVSR